MRMALFWSRARDLIGSRGMPSGFGVFLAPFMAMAMRRVNQKDLARLKAILEEQIT
jgi:hypothetical protein